MELTPEKRQQILLGDDGLGHQDATRAPLHMQERIIEIQLAQAEHRSIPAPSAEYVREAEKRSLSTLGRRAINFGKRIFLPSVIEREETLEQTAARQAAELSFERGESLPTTAVARAISRRTGRSFEDILDDGKNRTFHRQHGLDTQAAGPMSEDERESFKRAFDRSMGLRPANL